MTFNCRDQAVSEMQNACRSAPSQVGGGEQQTLLLLTADWPSNMSTLSDASVEDAALHSRGMKVVAGRGSHLVLARLFILPGLLLSHQRAREIGSDHYITK